MYSELKSILRESLNVQANADTKSWWENYVKESAPFMGVTMPIIRTVVHGWYKEHVKNAVPMSEQLNLALSLFEGSFTEEKLAGTLCIQEILMPVGMVDIDRDIDRFAALFSTGKIYDWNCCDWFCVKVLGPLILTHGKACADHISSWRTARNLWQARASLVPFTKVAGNPDYYADIELTCRVLIRREERFGKTAVGWILRDISKHDNQFVRKFLDENLLFFTVECVKNATKYFPKEDQKAYLSKLKS